MVAADRTIGAQGRGETGDDRADQAIDYTREDFAQTGQRYDVMLDLVGNRSLSDAGVH